MRGAMPQNRENVHLDRHKTLTGPLRLLNGVSPGANCPFDGRHQSILGFPMCFKKRLLCLLSVSKSWNCQQSYRVFI